MPHGQWYFFAYQESSVTRVMVEDVGVAQARFHSIPLEEFQDLPPYPMGVHEMKKFFQGQLFSEP